jgi:hypothetical protein
MNRLEHLGTNKGAARDDALKGYHMANVRGSECARADMVIAKRTVEANAMSLAFNVMLVNVIYLLYDNKKCLVRAGRESTGCLRRPSATSMSRSLSSETGLIQTKDTKDVIFVVID